MSEVRRDGFQVLISRTPRSLVAQNGLAGCAAAMAAFDAVDGSSTGHVSAMDVGAVKAPTDQRRSTAC